MEIVSSSMSNFGLPGSSGGTRGVLKRIWRTVNKDIILKSWADSYNINVMWRMRCGGLNGGFTSSSLTSHANLTGLVSGGSVWIGL
jgi:hypothetical protein